jgi:cellulose synthase operon protein C
MKNVVNRRFLIALIIGVILLGAAVHGLHAYQVNRQSSFLLDEGRRAAKEHQFERAVSRYRQYTSLVPLDIDAQAEFGLILADLRALRDATFTLEKVLRSQPDRDDIRHRLVLVEMEIGRVRDAQAHLQEFLLKKTPADAGLWQLLGRCQAALGDYKRANDSWLATTKYDPTQIDAYAARAKILRVELKDTKEADKAMDDMVLANPKSAHAHALFGEYLGLYGEEDRALAEAQAALTHDPRDSQALLLAARLWSGKKNFDKACEFAQHSIDFHPAQADGYTTLANILRRQGNSKKAITVLETGLEKTSADDVVLLGDLGQFQIEAGESAKAKEILERLRKLPPDDRLQTRIAYLEAELEFANQHWQQAIQRFEQVAPRLTYVPDLLKHVRYQVATCHARLGNLELQLAAFRAAALVDRSWGPARLGIASTLQSLGRFDEALEEYRQISALPGISAAGAAGEAQLLIQKNLARIPAEQDWKAVDAILDQLTLDNPDSSGVALLRAEALVGKQQEPEAEKILLTARSKSPDRTELWTGMLKLATQEQQWEHAEQLLDEADRKFGDQVWLRLARGSYLLARYKQESAPKLEALGKGGEKLSREDLVRLYQGLASRSFESGDTKQAMVFARRACDADPMNWTARILLFDLAFVAGDPVTIEQTLKEIRGLEGEGPFWHYGQAALCLVGKSASPALDAAALKHLDEARKLRPGWSRVPFLAARIMDHQDQSRSEAALKNYLEAIDLGERDPNAVRRAIELLYSKQRYAEADQLLRRVEQQPVVLSNAVELMDSEISARLGNLDRALGSAVKAAANSLDWRNHVWLGQLQGSAGLHARAAKQFDLAKSHFRAAEESLRSAIRLKPDAPEAWVALVQFYAVVDRKTEAESTLRLAEKKLAPGIAALALAPCFEGLGQLDEAAKRYELAAAQDPQDPNAVRRLAEFYMRSGRQPDAEVRLRTIVSGQVTAKARDVAWARRALASMLRASGNYPKIQQALALLDQNLTVDSTAEDQKERAITLGMLPEPQRRREAIQILEGLLPSQPDAADIQMTLVRLYLAQHDWPHASQHLRSLISGHDQDSRYVALYVAQLLERHETNDAELWIRRLEQFAAHEFSTASLKAQALVQQNQIDQALATMRDYLADPNLSAVDRVRQTRVVAARFEELAHELAGPEQQTGAPKLLAEAERLNRDFVKQQPSDQLVLATFLGRRARFDESLDIMELAAPTANPKAFAVASDELFSHGIAGTAPGQRLEKLLLSAVEEQKRPIPLLMALGSLRMRQDRFDEAILIYREVLKNDSANVAAMNDLAVLLALERKDLSEAQQLIEKAIGLAGPLPALLDSRASVFLALGKPQKALDDLDEVASEEPRPNRQFHRALAFFQLDRKEDARKALREARTMGLKPEQLIALERPDYQQLTAKLER